MSCVPLDEFEWHDESSPRSWFHEPVRLSIVAEVTEREDDDSSIAKEFQAHAERWLADTANSSSLQQAVMHPSYQRIIGMGRAVLPLIFERLQEQPDPWFWALRAITGENPVHSSDAGRVRKMAEVWLAWARARQLL
jgi:hypothetical protein